MKHIKDSPLLLWTFLGIEAALYIHLLCTNHPWSMFGSIALCFLFALCYLSQSNLLLTIGLACTVAADVCLVLCQPQQKVIGMVFFLLVQCTYAIHLQKKRRDTRFLWIRLGLIGLAELIVLIVLREKTDALALISLAYYANMVLNIAEGFAQFSINKQFTIGLILFLLCDTVIGLQVAADGYLAIATDSLLYQLLYPGLNLAWLFYLPAQVLIAVSARCQKA